VVEVEAAEWRMIVVESAIDADLFPAEKLTAFLLPLF
jgi:hypothetical protein